MLNPPHRNVEGFLARTIFQKKSGAVLSALAAGSAGGVVLLITGALVYGIVWAVTHNYLTTSPAIRVVVSCVVLLLLFVGNSRVSPRELETYSFTTGTYSNQIVTFYVPGIGMASNVNPLAPDSVASYLKMMMTLLFTGPRLIVASVRWVLKGWRLSHLDLKDCSALLTVLLGSDRRVSFAEIEEKCPSLLLPRALTQLSDLEGILFLKSDPAGLALSSELRRSISTYLDQATSDG